MIPPAWPTALPQLPQRMTWRGGPQDVRAVFGPDLGVPLTRRRMTGAPEVYAGIFPKLSNAQRAAFRTFFDTDLQAGSLAFAWRDPVTDEVALWKVMGEGQAAYETTARGAGLHDLGLTLMRLPGTPWWAPYVIDGTLRIPYLAADYAAGVYGIDAVRALASAVAAQTGTFDLYTTYASGVTEIEPARVLTGADITNIWRYSEEFDNATAWIKNQVTITPNAAVAPDGTTTADKLVEDVAAGGHFVAQTFAPVLDQVYTQRVFAHAGEQQFLQLVFTNDAFGTTIVGGFDLSGLGAAVASVDGQASIVAIGSGWYDCRLTAIADVADPGTAPQIRLATSLSASAASYTGDGTSGLYIWGAQLVAADHPGWYAATGAAPAALPDSVPAAAPPGVTRVMGYTPA